MAEVAVVTSYRYQCAACLMTGRSQQPLRSGDCSSCGTPVTMLPSLIRTWLVERDASGEEIR